MESSLPLVMLLLQQKHISNMKKNYTHIKI